MAIFSLTFQNIDNKIIMMSHLRFFLVISAFLLLSNYGYAQSTAEPTIDGTLDNIQTLSSVEGNNSATWTAVVKGNNKVGQQVKIRMKLENPADASKFDLFRLAGEPGNITEIPLTFDSEGVAILNANDWYTLVEEDVNAAILKIVFKQSGIFKYELQLMRNDNNIIARQKETVRVASVAGLDDMIENTRISVYPVPSPAQDDITLNLGSLKNASVLIVDMLGKPVYKADMLSGTAKISTTSFAKGIYFVKVMKGSEAAMVRMVVQ
jgi:hypothetical protein